MPESKVNKKEPETRCLHCGELFIAHPSTRRNQEYCSEPECKRVSHNASSKKSYHNKRKELAESDPEELREVNKRATKTTQIWRKANPFYWKKSERLKKLLEKNALSDLSIILKDIPKNALSDLSNFINFCIENLPLLLGLYRV